MLRDTLKGMQFWKPSSETFRFYAQCQACSRKQATAMMGKVERRLVLHSYLLRNPSLILIGSLISALNYGPRAQLTKERSVALDKC